ncbi:hypothetical protein FP803_01735 [Candidatus Woesearchaeota archaeon]|nr:hypothetical protein [Candidatus Woesearchaeota archaeon]
MAKDIPKATIAVLLVLTILVSIIGTWTVLESISIKEASPVQKTVGAGDKNIKFSSEEPQEPVEDNTNIRFEIK